MLYRFQNIDLLKLEGLWFPPCLRLPFFKYQLCRIVAQREHARVPFIPQTLGEVVCGTPEGQNSTCHQ